jgi:hypothetical protein
MTRGGNAAVSIYSTLPAPRALRSSFSFGDMRARSFGAVLDVGGKSAIDGSLAMAKIERQRLKGSDCEWLS